VMPLFCVAGTDRCDPIASMPGNARLSPDRIADRAREIAGLGIPGVLLFGVSEARSEDGAPAWDADGPVPAAIRAIREAAPGLCIFTDVCLCAYTTHGHCGIVAGDEIRNDETLKGLARMALCHARAGADFVAPSDMMDGRVGHLRQALDAAGFANTGILSYAVKYASAYYGPFRDAAQSAPAFGDRRTHQMDSANVREAVREARLDAAEGADMVMVKPALAYLDVLRAVREAVELPLAAYNVSGEFCMVKAAAERGWIDERAVVLETLLAMRRAGADILITYHAMDAARWLVEVEA
jgi:porphobilinogen synthase